MAQASATDLVGPDDRTRVFGLLGAAYGVGFVIGPAIGGLAALGGSRVPFFVAAGIAGVNAVVAVRRLPETRPTREPGPTGLRHRPGARLGAGDPSDDRGARRHHPGARRLVQRLRNHVRVVRATATGFRSGHRSGAVFAMVGVVSAVVQGGLVRPLAARLGDAGCLRIGLGAEALGLVLLPTVHARVDLVLPLILVTAGQSLSTPTLNALVVARVGDAGRRGSALGVQQGLSSLARIVGPAVRGAVLRTARGGGPFRGGRGGGGRRPCVLPGHADRQDIFAGNGCRIGRA